jgi:hypothetical protein
MTNAFRIHDIEQIFPVDRDFVNDYTNRYSSGYSLATNSSVAIFTIARNIGDKCKNNLDKLLYLAQKFKEYKIFIYENDSRDDTSNRIADWSKTKDNVVFVSEKLGERYMPLSKSSVRTNNLARCRNTCKNLSIIHNYQFEYALVIDMDFVDVSEKGLFHGLSYFQNDGIDAVCGNSFFEKEFQDNQKIMTNYDSWAYRHTWWSDKQDTMMWFQFWMPPVGSPPFLVNSAFGGSCWYKSKYFLSGEYSGGDCEHVNFHKNIKTKNPEFHLYLDPSQIMLV